jgi:hypothetical protein
MLKMLLTICCALLLTACGGKKNYSKVENFYLSELIVANPKIPTLDVTSGPLPEWISPPPADSFVTQALETLTNPITGEQFTVPTGGYTIVTE